MNKCSCNNCDLEVFENSDKCILHCEKDDWNKNKEIKEGREFWDKILLEKIKKDDYDFSYIVFPYFYSAKIEEKDNNFYTFDSFNFFEKNKEYAFEKEVNFNNAVFTSHVNFSNVKFKEKVTFEKTKFLDSIHLNDTIFEKGVSFSGATFEKSTIFNSLKCENLLNLEKVIIKDNFHLMRLENENLKISFNDAEFYEKSRIEIFDSNVGNLSLEGIFNSAEKIVFNRLIVDKKFILQDMNLNNLEILYLDISNAKIDLFNVLFEKSVVSNINLGENIEDRFTYYRDNKKYFSRDIMRQFKHLFEQSGNIIEANKFYALEMKEREDELERDIREGKNFFEWLVFKIHGLSSNHSQDWLLALFWIISFTLLSVTIEKIFSSHIGLSDKCVVSFLIFSMIVILNIYLANSKKVYYLIFIAIYFFIYLIFTEDLYLKCFSKTLNPFSLMQANDPINGIELLYKIIIAYLIYQLIISIRQNTRRK
ncbi:pentapeptide repeat-containing protein [Aliarcobacter butzleri]|uniref:pentapeptide repeat-containing protein n=1 Tax=Aliarcobacter butzleri TaxID=28197 RepID=UPI00344E73C2